MPWHGLQVIRYMYPAIVILGIHVNKEEKHFNVTSVGSYSAITTIRKQVGMPEKQWNRLMKHIQLITIRINGPQMSYTYTLYKQS